MKLLSCVLVVALDVALGRINAPLYNRWIVRGGAAASEEPTMTETEIEEMLSMVPVFAIADSGGRAVLMRRNESSKPQQLLFTDVDVAKAHVQGAARATNDTKLQLRLSTMTVAHALSRPVAAEESEVDFDRILVADPRELHVARQLLLRGAGVTTNFTDEKAVAEAASKLETGLDLARGVPLFSLDELNSTVLSEGAQPVHPWFMSFADLAQAYVAKHAKNTSDTEASGAALAQMLASGGLTVATVERVITTMREPGAVKRGALIIPPSSSVELLQEQYKNQQENGGDSPLKRGAAAGGEADDMIAKAAQRINSDEQPEGGLFD